MCFLCVPALKVKHCVLMCQGTAGLCGSFVSVTCAVLFTMEGVCPRGVYGPLFLQPPTPRSTLSSYLPHCQPHNTECLPYFKSNFESVVKVHPLKHKVETILSIGEYCVVNITSD